MRISDWSSDVCSSDLRGMIGGADWAYAARVDAVHRIVCTRPCHLASRSCPKRPPVTVNRTTQSGCAWPNPPMPQRWRRWRSEEHTSELQSLMRISYAGFCLKKKKQLKTNKAHE